jgi:23S rRNA (uracil1939-C5)-methyltransferase
MAQVTITKLTQRGLGLSDEGHHVPRTLPSEVVDIDVDGSRVTGMRVVIPSADRVRPPCGHFKTCGGCLVQHASDPVVEEWKTGIVRAGLSAQGIETEMRPILTSHAQSRRRAKLSGRRTKKGAMVGFHGLASDTLIAVPNCQLLVPELIALIPVLELMTVEFCSRKGELDYTVTHSDVGPDILVTGGKLLTDPMRAQLAMFADKQDLARLTWDDEPIVMRRPPTHLFGTGRVVPPPGAFLQATQHGEATLLATVQEIVGNAKRVADLFAGSGTFALPLSQSAEVLAVESEEDMMKALDTGWRKAEGVKKITTVTRDLFRRPLYPDELKKLDALVIDPPRAGAEAQMQQLAQTDIPLIASVSCNPITFARDAKILIDGGYTLDWVQPVDQFRWAAHVELVAKFSRK